MTATKFHYIRRTRAPIDTLVTGSLCQKPDEHSFAQHQNSLDSRKFMRSSGFHGSNLLLQLPWKPWLK